MWSSKLSMVLLVAAQFSGGLPGAVANIVDDVAPVDSYDSVARQDATTTTTAEATTTTTLQRGFRGTKGTSSSPASIISKFDEEPQEQLQRKLSKSSHGIGSSSSSSSSSKKKSSSKSEAPTFFCSDQPTTSDTPTFAPTGGDARVPSFCIPIYPTPTPALAPASSSKKSKSGGR